MQIIFLLSTGSIVWALVWYFNEIGKRNFCKKETDRANDNYLRLKKVEKNSDKLISQFLLILRRIKAKD